MKIAKVVFNIPLNRSFDYRCDRIIERGVRVLVDFGGRKKVGICVAMSEQSDFTNLKSISQILDDSNIFGEKLYEILEFSSHYYHHPLGETLFMALPKKLREGESLDSWRKFFTITEQGVRALSFKSKVSSHQRSILEQFLQGGGNNYLSKDERSLQILCEKGFLAPMQEGALKLPPWHQKITEKVRADRRLSLNLEQDLALRAINKHQGYQCFLLRGVTGSGKTEVYLQAIEKILQHNKQVLVLVPEIGLTPQTLRRFSDRFCVPMLTLHSHMSDSDRKNAFIHIKDEQVALVIGTRSALFAPFANLGLIIIDEEHDASFKQMDGIRYNARDVAIYRASYHNIPIILGSASPSLETIYNSSIGKNTELVLTKRAGISNSCEFVIIDLKKSGQKNIISYQLEQEMHRHLEQGNQVLLFLNRRGFSPVYFCRECSAISSCGDCNKPFTYHRKRRILHCHRCGAQRALPAFCRLCGSQLLATVGFGTEQLEMVLQRSFSHYQSLRIDRDTTTQKGAFERKIKAIQQKEVQIIIGTQMLAKGHHFPDVTLVALLDVDSALFSYDFRSEEKFAQLFTQVAGRGGRGSQQGVVMLQTNFPEHPLIQMLIHEDYYHFAKHHLCERKNFALPPFSYQALCKISSKNEALVKDFTEQIEGFFHNIQKQEQELYLMPIRRENMLKRAGRFYENIIIGHPSRAKLQQILTAFDDFRSTLSMVGDVRLILDVDPQDFN